MNSKHKNFVSCVVYLHNDGERLISFLNQINGLLDENFEKYEIICVDDASTDDSVECLHKYMEISESSRPISLVNMSYYQGKEASMNAGRDLAVGDYVFEFDDAVIDYEPYLILEVYQKALEGNDIVAAAPRNHISFSSKLFYWAYNWGNKSANKLQHERFRMVSRRAINRIGQMNLYIPYRKAMYVNSGLKMDTIFYDSKRVDRRDSNKQERENRSGLAFDSFIIFTNILEKISMALCFCFLLVMVVVACYVIWSVFSEVKPVEGWMSTIGLIAFGFFGLFLLMTLILKYLSVILNLILKKQRYVISGIDKINK